MLLNSKRCQQPAVAAIQDINRMRHLIKFYLSDDGSPSSTFPAGHAWHLKDRFHDASGRWKNHLHIHFLVSR